MFKRKDGLMCEKITLGGMKSPKYFYGKKGQTDQQQTRDIKKQVAEWTREQENGPLLATLADSWLASHTEAGNLANNTISGYNAPLKRIKSNFVNKYAKEITPGEIQAFINNLAKKGFKRTTVQRPLDVLRMIYDYAIVTTPGIDINPCTAVKLPQGLTQQHRELAAPEDIERIKAAVSHTFGLFAFLLLYTGCRRGEALALTWEDFDWEAKVIHITKDLDWPHNQPIIGTVKSKAGLRDIPILDPLLAALPKSWTGYLFSSDGGKTPLSEIEFRHRWEAYCQNAGLADAEIQIRKVKSKSNLKHTEGQEITKNYRRTIWHYHLVPHQLRHEFATICLDAGLTAKEAITITGHAEAATLENIYQHIRDSRKAGNADKLNQFVTGGRV